MKGRYCTGYAIAADPTKDLSSIEGCGIAPAARRPADPVKSCPCLILRGFYLEIGFCAPFGASRLSARLFGGGS